MKNQDPFKTLGLKAKFYSESDLKKAYMEALKTSSPNQDPNAFKKVREAYETIKQSMSVYGTQKLAGFAKDNDIEKEIETAYLYIENKSKNISSRKQELAMESIKKKILDIKQLSTNN